MRAIKQVLASAFKCLYIATYMALAIKITDGRGLSNEALREVLMEKSKVANAFFSAVNSRLTSCSYITNKTERFSFESGHDVWV